MRLLRSINPSVIKAFRSSTFPLLPISPHPKYRREVQSCSHIAPDVSSFSRRRKRVGSSTVDAPTADAPNVVWVVDFQFDADEHGRLIKICSIVDEHTRECIGGLVERSITADRLTAHLEDLVAARGAPAVLRSDNGPEFISEAMADWAGTRTGLSYIPPGSPWRNGYVESFNSRIRDECLNINSFYSLLHAQVIIGDWKDEYNHQRRHSSLGYLTPAEYARQCTHQMETDDSQSDRTE